MDFREYEEKAKETALYPRIGENVIYPTLGLVGEAGEIANKVKKIERDQGGILTEETKKMLLDEAGDVLWYVSQLARELGGSLEDVARSNIEKLAARKERGVLHGSGDNR